MSLQAFAGFQPPSNNNSVKDVLISIRARSHASLNPKTGVVESVSLLMGVMCTVWAQFTAVEILFTDENIKLAIKLRGCQAI